MMATSMQQWLLRSGLLKVCYLTQAEVLLQGIKSFCSKSQDKKNDQPLNICMLEVLACPLSKKPVRYDPTNNELVCDDLGVAYPIVNGIPNLNPHYGRLLKRELDDSPTSSPRS